MFSCLKWANADIGTNRSNHARITANYFAILELRNFRAAICK